MLWSHRSLITIQSIRYGTTRKPLIPTCWRPFRELHNFSRTRTPARCFFLAETESQWYVDFVSRRTTKLTLSGNHRPSVVGRDEAHATFASSFTSACHLLFSTVVGRVKQKRAPRGELSVAHNRPPCDSKSNG